VRSPGSPSLSHHACVVVDARYAVIIGGWNGEDRTSNVYIFDAVEACWSAPSTKGFPTGGGLSSHAAVLLSRGHFLVIGREGAARMQRRFACAFMLSGNPAVGCSGDFKYSEHSIYVTSRSGHTLHTIGRSVFIIGGRDDKVLETHPCELVSTLSDCSVMSRLAKQSSAETNKTKNMSGRRHHVSFSSSDVVFVHGGWAFDGPNRDPVGHMFALFLKPTLRWVYLGDSGIGRAGHVCCAFENNVYLHGGEGARGTIHGSLYELDVPQ